MGAFAASIPAPDVGVVTVPDGDYAEETAPAAATETAVSNLRRTAMSRVVATNIEAEIAT
jgi:hypothetical protein